MDNSNKTWLWILAAFFILWLLSKNARSNQEQLFVVGGHEHHVGMAGGSLNEGEIGARRPPSRIEHVMNTISHTHHTVREWYEIFENLAIGSEKLLSVVTVFTR